MKDSNDRLGKELILPGWFLDLGDYTYYVNRKAHSEDEKGKYPEGHVPDLSRYVRNYDEILDDEAYSNGFSASCSGRVHHHEDYPHVLKASNLGRLLICKAYAGEAIAVTARRLEKPIDPKRDKRRNDLEKKIKAIKEDIESWKCGYADEPNPSEIPFAVSINAVYQELEELFLGGQKHSGLILVSGATNSAKSELTRGIIAELIKRQVKEGRNRWPHLVTYEDPIEKRLYPSSLEALNHGVEYTPRQQGIDVGSLGEAFDDALRQTPSIFYVGEVRKDEDWKELMRFAGTGHLVVATSHAGSLVETMERIFHGMAAETAADRGQIAGRVLAVIHQRKFDLSDAIREKIKGEDTLSQDLSQDFRFEVLLPTVWRRTPAGIAALVSDGLSSVLPNYPLDRENLENGPSSLGRQFFAEQFRFKNKGVWQDIFHVDFLSQEIRKIVELEKGKLPPVEPAEYLCSQVQQKEISLKVYRSLAYVVVRLWRDAITKLEKAREKPNKEAREELEKIAGEKLAKAREEVERKNREALEKKAREELEKACEELEKKAREEIDTEALLQLRDRLDKNESHIDKALSDKDFGVLEQMFSRAKLPKVLDRSSVWVLILNALKTAQTKVASDDEATEAEKNARAEELRKVAEWMLEKFKTLALNDTLPKIQENARKCEEDGAWAAYQSEAIRLDLMGE